MLHRHSDRHFTRLPTRGCILMMASHLPGTIRLGSSASYLRLNWHPRYRRTCHFDNDCFSSRPGADCAICDRTESVDDTAWGIRRDVQAGRLPVMLPRTHFTVSNQRAAMAQRTTSLMAARPLGRSSFKPWRKADRLGVSTYMYMGVVTVTLQQSDAIGAYAKTRHRTEPYHWVFRRARFWKEPGTSTP